MAHPRKQPSFLFSIYPIGFAQKLSKVRKFLSETTNNTNQHEKYSNYLVFFRVDSWFQSVFVQSRIQSEKTFLHTKKVVIKIDKGIRKKEKMTAAEIAPEVEIDRLQNISDIVNNWISERRANRLAEKSFSVERISVWKIMSLSSNFGQHSRNG